ncbi:MAG TPA: DUF3426 domain-containing protein [Burkholderiaceae bacterium]|nr:DUF3426 domain-containing protein [Burkholderiaceae bacterium]
MALATQCPHCGTTFRVAHDQLKLRAGLVRCGACKEIFNGIEHLLHPAAEPVSAPSAAATTGEQETDVANSTNPSSTLAPETDRTIAESGQHAIGARPHDQEAASETFVDDDHDQRHDDEREADTDEWMPETDEAGSDAVPAEPAAPDPLQRMTLMDFAHGDPISDDADSLAADKPDELERALDDLQRKPLRRSRKWPTAAPSEADEPDFVARARRQQGREAARRALLAGACFLLLLGALAQGAYTFRSQIAAHFPLAKPMLAAACTALGCRVDLPMQIESVTIESSDLQVLAPDQGMFALSVLLRNRSSTVEAWPHIELTLNDASEQALVRRVFIPHEYLPENQNAVRGFAANSEQALRIHFGLATPKAAGYRIYLFYS